MTAKLSAIQSWASAGTGLEYVAFEDQGRLHLPDQWVSLSLVGIEDEGIDFSETVTTAGRRLERVTASRILQMKIAVESFEQDLAHLAINYLEQLRALSYTRRFRAILAAQHVVYVESTNPAADDYEVDDHVISRYSSTMRFRTVFTVTDDAAGADVDYFTRVTGAGAVSGPDATIPFDSAKAAP